MNDTVRFSIKEMQEDTKELIAEVLQLLELNNVKNIHLNIFFEYVEIVEDKRWDKANRNYYLHNIPVESLSNDAQVRENILRCNEPSIEEIVQRKYEMSDINATLRLLCTDVQKKRYIKYHYLKMTYAEIARQENVSESAIRQSLRRVKRKIKK